MIKSKSQEKNSNQKIINKKDIFNFPINSNFSLSNINYFPNNRNKKSIINSVSLNEDNNIRKDMSNNYKIKNETSDKYNIIIYQPVFQKLKLKKILYQ